MVANTGGGSLGLHGAQAQSCGLVVRVSNAGYRAALGTHSLNDALHEKRCLRCLQFATQNLFQMKPKFMHFEMKVIKQSSRSVFAKCFKQEEL